MVVSLYSCILFLCCCFKFPERRQFKRYCQDGPEGSYLTWPKIVRLMDSGFVFDPAEWKKNRQKVTPLSPKQLTLSMIPKRFQFETLKEPSRIEERRSGTAVPGGVKKLNETVIGRQTNGSLTHQAGVLLPDARLSANARALNLEKSQAVPVGSAQALRASAILAATERLMRNPAGIHVSPNITATGAAANAVGALGVSHSGVLSGGLSGALPGVIGAGVGMPFPVSMMVPPATMMAGMVPAALPMVQNNNSVDSILGRYGRMLSNLDATRASLIQALSNELNGAGAAGTAGLPPPPSSPAG